ncbi:MAG: hypothetical protein WBA07_03455 [Rivularia sp. (in: cyanobacteria)]
MSHPSLMRLTATVQNLIQNNRQYIKLIFLTLLILPLRCVLHSVRYLHLGLLSQLKAHMLFEFIVLHIQCLQAFISIKTSLIEVAITIISQLYL